MGGVKIQAHDGVIRKTTAENATINTDSKIFVLVLVGGERKGKEIEENGDGEKETERER